LFVFSLELSVINQVMENVVIEIHSGAGRNPLAGDTVSGNFSVLYFDNLIFRDYTGFIIRGRSGRC
jgi:hypothetical protein